MLDSVSESVALLDGELWFPELQPEEVAQDQRTAASIISGGDGIGDVDCVAVPIQIKRQYQPSPLAELSPKGPVSFLQKFHV